MSAKSGNALLFLSVIALLFLLGEISMRGIDFFQKSGESKTAREKTGCVKGVRKDAVLNHAHVPGAKFAYVARDGKEFRTEVEYNSRGLNDREFAYEKPAGKTRILVLGDSFVEAREVKREDNFCKLLEAGLNSKGFSGQYEVVNMGVASYSPILEYLYFKYEGVKYGPDIVILCFFMNDVYDDRTYKRKAVFDEKGLPESVYWRTPDKDKNLTGWKKFERRVSRAFKGVINRSKFYVFLKKRFYRLLKKAGMREEDTWDVQFRILSREPYPGEDDMWNDTLGFVLETGRLAGKTAGDKFLFVVIPLEAQFSGRFNDTAGRFYFSERPYSERAEKKIRDFCLNNGIEYISLLDEFEKRKAGGLYFPNDGHFNAKGHRETANIVLEKIKALGWLKEKDDHEK